MGSSNGLIFFGWMRRQRKRTVLLTRCSARLQSGVTMGFVIIWNDDRQRALFLRNLMPSSSAVAPWCLIPLWFILMCSCGDVPVTLKDLRGGLSVSAQKDSSGLSYSFILCQERRLTASWEKRQQKGPSSKHQPWKQNTSKKLNLTKHQTAGCSALTRAITLNTPWTQGIGLIYPSGREPISSWHGGNQTPKVTGWSLCLQRGAEMHRRV